MTADASMGSTCHRVIVAALAIVSAGCITYESQTITYEHQVAEDKLLIYNVYSGIFGNAEILWGTAPGVLTSLEEEELSQAVQGRRLYFFDNWTRVIALDQLEAQLLVEPDLDLTPLERRADTAKREAWAALVRNMTVSSGPFFLDAAGRLCTTQRVTISNLSETLRLLNVGLTSHAAALAEVDPEWSDQAADIHEWLAFERNRFTLRYPRDGEPRNLLPDAPPLSGPLIATRVFGSVNATRVTITERVEAGFLPNAIDFVRSRFGIARFDVHADAERFFSAGGG